MPKGVELLAKKKDFFKDTITPETLSAQSTGDGTEQGTSPLYWLCATPEGIQLLADNSDLINQNLITRAALLEKRTNDGLYKGTNPFYMLITRREGIKLLTDNWVYFEKHVSKDILSGSAISSLASSNEGL
jgi:hypothetical protein